MSDVMVSPETQAPAPTSSPTATTPTPTPTPASTTEAPSLVNQAPQPEAFVPLTPEVFTLPEGFTLEEEAMGSFLEVMNNRDLTPQQQAQSLLELQASLTTSASEAGSAKWNQEQQDWQAQVEADPELGGANLPKTLSAIGGLMNRFGNDELRAYMDVSGAGNNPLVIRFLATVAGQLSEASPAPAGTPPGATSLTTAEKMYGGKPN